jgi:soluble lytic murein transglycosylase-like protein
MDNWNRYDSLFQYYSEKHGDVDWKLIKAQAIEESGLDPAAKSPAGAQGLSQFMPATFAEVSKNLGLKDASVWNPEHSIACQTSMMNYLITRFKVVEQALAAYNWGEGHVERGDSPRPLETQNYIRKVLALRATL